MKTESYTIKGFGDVRINLPDNETYHCVYLTETSDGYKVIGQTDDGLYSRTKSRLSKKTEFSLFKQHLSSNKTLNVRCLCEHEDKLTKNIIEQYLIYLVWEKLANEYLELQGKKGSIKIDFYNIQKYRNEDGLKQYIDERCGNLTLDHKEDLRYYLAHKNKFPHIEKILSNIEV